MSLFSYIMSNFAQLNICTTKQIRIDMSKFRILVSTIIGLSVMLIHAKVGGMDPFVTKLSVVNDLPSNSVSVSYEDSDGYIWLGTKDGLCRYDGYRLKIWRSNRENPLLLTDNDISALAEDHNKNLLIGTRHGMNVINADRTAVTRSSHPDLLDYEIRAIVPDNDNSIWVGTYKRLVRASADLGVVKNYDTSLPVTSVNTVFKDKNGNIWVSLWKSGIFRYNPSTDRFDKCPAMGSEDNPMVMIEKDGSYLLGTWGNGLWRMRKVAGTYITSQIKIIGTNDNLNDIFGLTSDKHGNIWFISHFGVYSGELSGNELYLHDISRLDEPMNNMFNRISCDKDGNIWITATNDGAYIVSRKTSVISRTPVTSFPTGNTKVKSTLTAIFQDSDRIWFNQPRYGMGIYNKTDGRILSYRNMPNLANLEYLSEVSVINQFNDNPNYIYVGSQHYPCIFIFERRGDNINIIDKIKLNADGKDGGAPRHIRKDSKGNLWIATDKNLLLQTSHGSIVYVIEGMRDIQSMIMDREGAIWVASLSKGIIKLSLSSASRQIKVNRLPINDTSKYSIVSMAMDNTGKTIWAIGKLGHIIKVDWKNGKAQDITEATDFKLSEYLLDIIIDKNNNKWLSSGKYIFKFNPDFKNCVQYSVCDAQYQDTRLNKGALYYDKNEDIIYYGCYGGLIAVNSNDDTRESASLFPPRVTDVKISGISLFDNPNNKTDFDRKTIYIPADSKNIQFEFSTLQYANPDKIRYSYRLKGVDKDWISVDGGSPIAFYNHIPSGDYILEVRATDDNGQWGAPTEYKIHKQFFWYETWWAYLSYLLILCAIFFTIYIYARRRSRERSAMRIAQLEKKKTEELTEIKLKYFANISHDFLTPITIISCLVDDIETVYGKIGPHLDKIRFNLTKVKSLIQQILDYRKIETGNMHLSVAENELCEFVDQICCNHFQPLMDKKHINFSYEHDCEPIHGYFDVDKVEKILFNVISNAYKYTPDGGSIDVSVNKELADDKETAVIKISDTGVGISKKNIDRIFNRFYTIDREERVESNGIGLSLVKDLIELHHGSISVESTPGKGSAFTLKIPVSRECYATNEITTIEYSNAEQCVNLPTDLETLEMSTDPVNRNITLLLVEDNEELLL